MSELERLRAALKPFADAWEGCGDGPERDQWSAWESGLAMEVTYGDFRRAHKALAGAKTKAGT